MASFVDIHPPAMGGPNINSYKPGDIGLDISSYVEDSRENHGIRSVKHGKWIKVEIKSFSQGPYHRHF